MKISMVFFSIVLALQDLLCVNIAFQEYSSKLCAFLRELIFLFFLIFVDDIKID